MVPSRGKRRPDGPVWAVVLLAAALAASCGSGRRTGTYVLSQAVSNKETVVYERTISFDPRTRLYHVRDRYRDGGLQMDAFYSAFDKTIKEEYQCNFRSNTKEGPYREWHRNGRLKFEGRFVKGRLNGPARQWYDDGRPESEENWLDGRLHGRVRYWSRTGGLEFDSEFENGRNLRPGRVSYHYLTFLPKAYAAEPGKKWPLVICLHGGSDRGTDLKKLYSSGLPDQVYRGRDFPFVIAAPQCPEHLRWSTEDWFESFFRDVTSRCRIDLDRIYLTGPSLGGSGTWYLAARYPEIFAAIAPLSGFTGNTDLMDRDLDALAGIPVWAFHGRDDLVVPFEETERMVRALEARPGHAEVRFTAEPGMGHWIHWQVYPGVELYDWLLRHSRNMKTGGGAAAASAAPVMRWAVQNSGMNAGLRGVSAVDDRTAWASGSKGTVLRTLDGGETWTAMIIPGEEATDFRDIEAFGPDQAVVMGIDRPARIYRTSDGGATWKRTFFDDTPGVFLDGLAFFDKMRGLAVGDPLDGRFYMIATEDGGATWKMLPPESRPPALDGAAAFAASGTSLTVMGESRAWLTTGGTVPRVWRTVDGGRHWEAAPSALLSGGTTTGGFSVAFLDALNGITVGGDYKAETSAAGNAAISGDGGCTWLPVKERAPRGFREAVAFMPGANPPIAIAVGPSGSDVSLDLGRTWTPIAGPLGFHALCFPKTGRTGWAVGRGGLVARLVPGQP